MLWGQVPSLLPAWCTPLWDLQRCGTHQMSPVHQTFQTAIERRKEVVHHEQIPDQNMSKQKKTASDKKSNFVIKAKSIPVTPKAVASSQGVMRARWLVSIYKEIENFLQNMAIEDADPSLVVKWKSSGRWPLPCQMVFVHNLNRWVMMSRQTISTKVDWWSAAALPHGESIQQLLPISMLHSCDWCSV